MSFFENLKMAFGSIAANKMRSLLTMLGIIIGISAVITITTLGTTLRATVKGALDSLGSNLFYVYLSEKNADNYYDTVEIEVTPDDLIQLSMLEELVEKYPDEIRLADENSAGSGTLRNSENKDVSINIVGAYNGTLDYNGGKILAGRNLTMRDVTERKYTCIVSDIFVRQYFKKGEDPLGRVIIVNTEGGAALELSIVGVYKYNAMINGMGATSEEEMKTPVYVPNTIAQQLQGIYYDPGLWGTMLSFNIKYDSKTVQDHIQSFFDEKYASNKNYGIKISSAMDQLKMIDTVINVITIVVAVIAAISLLVGGVGVMNIMLVSVTERTREIGIRKALGAKKRAIKRQFVTEAIIICLIGGIIGILIGLLNGELVGLVANMLVKSDPTYEDLLGNISIQPSTGAIMISLIFSMLTGVFFGLYPASKAAKMNPIDALRYD
ncbi:MAG: ABC transporter permease [Ruminococcus sp.]|nr:ABC transporter permease [Ruminococcus sp.]